MSRFALLAALACAGFSSSAFGQTAYTWNNTGTDFASATSWDPNAVPASTDSVHFNVLGTFGAGTINNPNLNVPVPVAQFTASNNAMFQGWSLTGSGGLTSGSASVSGLVTRGIGTTTIDLGTGASTSLTLTGATSATLNGAIDIGSGSALRLTGNTIGSLSGGSAISLRGGTLILDNSAGNPAGGQRLTGTGQINLAGGGSTLEFRSAGGGTDFTGLSGVLSLGAGDATIRANQTGSGALNITFGSLVRTNTSATINFASIGSGTLGGGGANDPSIKFTTAPGLTNGVIANAAASGALGFAIYNGTDFAGYDASNGVVAVTSIPVSGALTTAATQNSRLIGNATTAASSTVSYNTLKIAPSAGGQTLTIGSGGTLNVVGILLAGATDYSITGGTITGGATRYLYVTNPNTTLFVGSAFSTQIFNKAGDGFMVLTGTSNQVAFTSSQGVNLTGGTMRVTSTNFNLSIATAANLRFRGGVIEYDVSGENFTFARPLGVAAGNVNWALAAGPTTNAGSGGFSAFSTNPTNPLTNTLNVNLGGSFATLIWGGQTGTNFNFVQDGYALKFGSTKSNATVNFQNPIALDSGTPGNYLVREINVTKGAGTFADYTVISGAITGTATTDLLKTGTGVLVLATTNNYQGNTLIEGGTLNLAGVSVTLGTGNVAVGKGAVLAGTGTITPDFGGSKSVFVNPGGAIRASDVSSTSAADRTGTLTINSPLTIKSTATDHGTIQFEANRTGGNGINGTANVSRIVLGAEFDLNLSPGVGNQFALELVTSSATTPVVVGETYSVVLASVGPGGRIRFNDADLDDGNVIASSHYILRSSNFDFASGATLLQVSGSEVSGYNLNLTFMPVPVPEPATVLGLAAGALGLGRLVRRRLRREMAVARS